MDLDYYAELADRLHDNIIHHPMEADLGKSIDYMIDQLVIFDPGKGDSFQEAAAYWHYLAELHNMIVHYKCPDSVVRELFTFAKSYAGVQGDPSLPRTLRELRRRYDA